MARSKKNGAAPPAAEAKSGHNAVAALADDDTAALQTYFALKIRAARRLAEQAKGAYDVEREAVNALFSQARGELHMTRKEFEEVLALQDMTEAEFMAHEEARHRRLVAASLPVGTQLELFPLHDTVDDKIDAEANGFRAGRRADDPVPPDYIHPMFHPDWMGGYHRGVAANGELLGKAEAILAARKPKGELEPEPSDEHEIDPEAQLDEDAKRLAAAGWADQPEHVSELEPA